MTGPSKRRRTQGQLSFYHPPDGPEYCTVVLLNGCYADVMASIDKRMMIKTLKHFLRPYVGVSADNFDVCSYWLRM